MRLARAQSPEVQLTRLEVEKSSSDLALARTERDLRLHAGSGLGATSGIPQSIHGAVPSIAQVTLTQPLIDLARPRELVASEEHNARATQDRSIYSADILYFDFELACRNSERLRRELGHFARI